MKPKFRIGDRVRTIGLGDEWIVAGIDPLDTRRVYVSFDYNGTIGRGNLQSYLQLIPTDIVKVLQAVYSPAVERYEQLFGENRLLS